MITFKINSNRQKWCVTLTNGDRWDTPWDVPSNPITIAPTADTKLTGTLYFVSTDDMNNFYDGYGRWITLVDGSTYSYDDWKQELVIIPPETPVPPPPAPPTWKDVLISWLPPIPWNGPPLPRVFAIKWPWAAKT
jgi:hypothetical protein